MTRLGEAESARRGRTIDFLTALALAAVAFANLALPLQAQQMFGVDYLYLAFAALAAVSIARLPSTMRSGFPWIIVIALGLAILPGIVAGPLTAYGEQKIQGFIIVAMSIIAASSLFSSRRGAAFVLYIGGVSAIIVSLLVLTSSTVLSTGRVSLAGLNPINVARLTALGVPLLLGWAFGRRGVPFFRRALTLGLSVMCLYAAFLTGSRGPLLAVAIACLAMLAAGLSVLPTGARWAVPTTLIAAGALAYSVFNEEIFSEWATGRGDSGRSYLYQTAIQSILERPGGIGWGNFPSLLSGGVALQYPHNIYLEMGVEGGVLALVFVLILTLVPLVWSIRTYRRTRSRIDMVLVGVFVFALVNAQVSSDVIGNRMLWIVLVLAIVRHLSVERAEPSESGQRRRQLAARDRVAT